MFGQAASVSSFYLTINVEPSSCSHTLSLCLAAHHVREMLKKNEGRSRSVILCAVFTHYQLQNQKKNNQNVVLLCICVLFIFKQKKKKKKANLFSSLMLQIVKFHLPCLNAFINASQTQLMRIHMPRRYATNKFHTSSSDHDSSAGEFDRTVNRWQHSKKLCSSNQ